MSILRKYSWEAFHITTILSVIATLMVVTHLMGTALPTTPLVAVGAPLQSPSLRFGDVPIIDPIPRPTVVLSQPKPARPSNPLEVVVGPTGINNRYLLVSADRRSLSPTVDRLTVRLHVSSLASENLVSPFSSDMLDIRSPGLDPIDPKIAFHTPIPAGETRNQDVVFNIPSSLSLEKAVIDIHYYNYQRQIPLSRSPQAASD